MSKVKPRDKSLAEVEAILRDLAEYDNPNAYADPQHPHVYRFSIPGKKYGSKGAILTVEIDGIQLMSALRALFEVSLRGSTKLEGKSPSEVVSELANNQSFIDSESESYWFTLRNLPPLMNKFLVLISQMALVAPGATLFTDPKQRKEFQQNQKDLIEFNLRSLRKDMKRRLRIRGRGGKSPTLAPDLRSSLHVRYDGFHKAAKTIKKHHDSLYRTFCAQKHRAGREEWRAIWIDYAVKVFNDQPKEFLELFSEADQSSASDIAYEWIARETGHQQSYVRKLIKELRRSSRQKADVQSA